MIKDGQEELVDLDVDFVTHMLSWSPNDNDLLLLKNYEQRLFSYHLSTQQLSYLTAKEKSVRRGLFSVNKDVLYFVQEVNQQYNLYSKNITSQQINQLTQDGANYIQESSDGKFVYFTTFNEQGLWKVNVENGDISLVLKEFSKENYSNWQVVNNGVYFTKINNAKQGLFLVLLMRQKQRL